MKLVQSTEIKMWKYQRKLWIFIFVCDERWQLCTRNRKILQIKFKTMKSYHSWLSLTDISIDNTYNNS